MVKKQRVLIAKFVTRDIERNQIKGIPVSYGLSPLCAVRNRIISFRLRDKIAIFNLVDHAYFSQLHLIHKTSNDFFHLLAV